MKILAMVFMFVSWTTLYANEISDSYFVNSEVSGDKIQKTSTKRLLYFWASWCPDCRGKMRGELGNFVKENRDLDLVTVNLDKDFRKGKSFLEDERLNLSVIRDEDKSLRKSFDIYAVPGWVLLEKKRDWLAKDRIRIWF